jgi:predicted CoA-binding protein
MGKSVAIIGASSDRRRFGNKAVRAFLHRGFTVVPIHPKEGEIEGLQAYRSVLDVPGHIDMASMYVSPAVGEALLDELAKKGIAEVWFNPGAESPAVVERARALNLGPIVACSIIGIGENPSAY